LSPEHPFIIGPQDGFHVTVKPLESAPWIAAECSDQERQREVDELVRRSGEAASRVLVSEDDFGGVVWYACTLSDEQPNLADPMFFSRVQQLLHTPERIVGRVRLGDGALLNFREDGSNLLEGAAEGETVIFHPKALIDVYIAAPGPADGPFTRPITYQMAEVVAAICAFTLGRPVNLPPTIIPVPDFHSETVADLETRRAETKLTLARQHVPLDTILPLVVEDKDSWRRIRGASCAGSNGSTVLYAFFSAVAVKG
jgi:hypothetical protein